MRHARRWRPIPGRRFRARLALSARGALAALVAAAERTVEAWRLDSIESALALDLFNHRARAAALARIDQRRAALAGA